MEKTIYALFDDSARANEAITQLGVVGIEAGDVSVITREDVIKAGELSEADESASEKIATGVVKGGVIGGIAGLLVGVTAIAVPGIGALLIGGPIAAAFGLGGTAAIAASGAVTGALAGGLIGALVRLGVPEDEATKYESEVRERKILFAVPATEEIEDEVTTILEDNGGQNIRSFENRYDIEGDSDYHLRHAGAR